MEFFRKTCLAVAGFACIDGLVGVFTSIPELWQSAIVLCCLAGALGLPAIPALAGYQFTAWIVAAFAAAMVYPDRFLTAGPFDLGLVDVPAIELSNRWLVLIVVQLVMFGMGVAMSLRDFVGVVKMPYPVLIGVCLQFVIMPITGYALAKLFNFPPEIAAGVILIGSCSSGLASNVMCYLAGANLALSITLTAVATLLAPLATPFWMQRLAGEYVEVRPLEMTMQIVKIVIVPIGAAMVHDYLKHAETGQRRRVMGTAGMAAALALAIGIFPARALDATDKALHPIRESLLIFGAALLFALIYHLTTARVAWIERKTHLLSMFGIVYFTTITTAAGRDHLIVAGVALFLAAVVHNAFGYSLGYGMSRLFGLDRQSAITVAFEVGMQNGGMASGLASYMGKLGTVGLAAAVFSPWMNVTGSILANVIKWRRNRGVESADNHMEPGGADGGRAAGT